MSGKPEHGTHAVNLWWWWHVPVALFNCFISIFSNLHDYGILSPNFNFVLWLKEISLLYQPWKTETYTSTWIYIHRYLFKNDLIALHMKSKEKLHWNCYFSISLIHHSLFCYIIFCSLKWFKHTTPSVRENKSFVLAIQHSNSKNTILRLWYPETFQVIHKDKRWMYTWPWLGSYCDLIHVCAQQSHQQLPEQMWQHCWWFNRTSPLSTSLWSCKFLVMHYMDFN